MTLAPWSQTEETPEEQPQQNEPQRLDKEALAICNKVESDYAKKLRIWYDNTGSPAALKELTRYEEILKETCLKRAKDNGYWDPIGEVEKVWKGIFGK